MVKQNPYMEGVLAALTALVRAINDANYEVVVQKKNPLPQKVERPAQKQTNLKEFDTTKPFEVAETNKRIYRCSGCGMYGHNMGNKNRPCKGRY